MTFKAHQSLKLVLALYEMFPFAGIQIESRNNKLEMQSVNNKVLIEELEKLLERLRVPPDVCWLLPIAFF